MLVQRLRRWPNVKPTLDPCFLFCESYHTHPSRHRIWAVWAPESTFVPGDSGLGDHYLILGHLEMCNGIRDSRCGAKPKGGIRSLYQGADTTFWHSMVHRRGRIASGWMGLEGVEPSYRPLSPQTRAATIFLGHEDLRFHQNLAKIL